MRALCPACTAPQRLLAFAGLTVMGLSMPLPHITAHKRDIPTSASPRSERRARRYGTPPVECRLTAWLLLLHCPSPFARHFSLHAQRRWCLSRVASTVCPIVRRTPSGRYTDTSDDEESEEGDSSDGDFGGGGRRLKRLRGKAERGGDAILPSPLPRLNDALPQKASQCTAAS